MKVNEILKPGYSFNRNIEHFISEEKLYEGLIISYSIEKIISHINSKIQNTKIITLKSEKEKNKLFNCFAIIFNKENQDFDNLFKILSLYGWYIAFIEFKNNDNKIFTLRKDISLTTIENLDINWIEATIKIEAKYDVQIDKKHWPKYLYCIAPSNYKSKIEKIGLIPKAGNNVDNQPERIYLGLDKAKLLKHMYPQLKQHNLNYKKHGGLMMTLDSDKFPDNVRLFDDINWPDDAYYTVVNIPPNSIIKIEEI